MKNFNAKLLSVLLGIFVLLAIAIPCFYAVDIAEINAFLYPLGCEPGQIIPISMVMLGIISGIIFEKILGTQKLSGFVLGFFSASMVVTLCISINNNCEKALKSMVFILVFVFIFYITALINGIISKESSSEHKE